MKLILDLITGGGGRSGGGESRSFDHRGLTIGRGEDSDWMLDDPSRFLSKSHCFIDYVDGTYVLFDLSTNGTFVNGSDSPLGRANSLMLSEGDRIAMGDYQFAVRMSGEEAPAASDSIDVDDPAAYPFGLEPRQGSPSDPIPAWQSEPKPEDPFAFTAGGDAEPSWARPAEPDHLPAAQAAFRLPTPNFSEIPEDWAETPTAAPERGRAPARPIPADWGTPAQQPPVRPLPVEQPPPSAAAEAPPPKAAEWPPHPTSPREPPAETRPAPMPTTPAETPAAAVDDDLLQVMLEAAGLDPSRFPAERGREIAAMFGEIARASVQGLIETLNARSVLKTEFRIERTAIQPRNNNPLKFSATATEALGAILSPPLPAFAKGADAIAEGFRDLQEHQIGTVSGMEQALRHLLDSLAPAAVETAVVSGMLPGGRKARLWDTYVALHRQMTESASDNIREIFGTSFAEGYDKQKDRI